MVSATGVLNEVRGSGGTEGCVDVLRPGSKTSDLERAVSRDTTEGAVLVSGSLSEVRLICSRSRSASARGGYNALLVARPTKHLAESTGTVLNARTGRQNRCNFREGRFGASVAGF